MLKKGEHIEGTPVELQVLLDKDKEAKMSCGHFGKRSYSKADKVYQLIEN